jgi:hypothetical protein
MHTMLQPSFMKHAQRIPLFLAIALVLASCAKDELAREVGLVPATCGTDGARLSATVNGSSYCASAQLVATGDSTTVIVTGVDLSGSTLVLQFDTLAVGTHVVTEAANGLLYMHNGTGFVVGPGQTGTLQITAHDASAHRLKAHFEAVLFNEASGTTRSVEGEVDVTYTVGG